MNSIFDEPTPTFRTAGLLETNVMPENTTTPTPTPGAGTWWSDLFRTIPSIIDSLKGNPQNPGGGNYQTPPASTPLLTQDTIITVGIVVVVAIIASKLLGKLL